GGAAVRDQDGRRLRRGPAGVRRPLRRCSPAPPVLFHAHAHSQGPLREVATDLRSLAWHCSLDLDDLQDLQDDVGIGGSCSDFVDYLYSSLSSAQVKLLFPAAHDILSPSL
ncbi:unnamed protein product, partial [Urochloa humidicola]